MAGRDRGVRNQVRSLVMLVAVVAATAGAQNYSAWTDSATIRLNTTSTGAKVAASVTGFPVLVRLNSTNFDFSLAKGNGGDIRFAKSNGTTPLAYQIEHWDSSAQTAAIWVRVDTVYGGNATQFLRIYYGNPGANDSTRAASVFSPSSGFQGVWHLNEDCPDGTAGLLDATGQGHNIRPDSVNSTLNVGSEGTAAPGLAGRSVQLGGTVGNMIYDGDQSKLLPESSMVVSAWVRPTTLTPNAQIVAPRMFLAYENPYMLAFSSNGARAAFTWVNSVPNDTTLANTSPSFVANSKWYHIAGVRTGDSLKLFVDGRMRVWYRMPGTNVRNASGGFRVGAENLRSRNMKGYIDEIRVQNVARDSAWIKLEYQNQQTNDSLVTVEGAVCAAPSISLPPTAQSATAGQTVVFSVTATGTSISYQWQRDSAGSGFQTISGAPNNRQYSFAATLGQDGNQYRCVVVSGCGAPNVTSAAASLTVTAGCVNVPVTNDPQNQSVVEKSSVTLTAAASGTSPQYQWQRNNANIIGANAASYAFPAQRWDNGATYRCIVSNTCPSADTSAAAVLSVSDTTRPHPTTDLTVNALSPTSANVRWTTPETDSTDCGRVAVYYATAGYPQPNTATKTTVADSAVRYSAGERSLTVSGLSANTTYYFSIFVRDTTTNLRWAYADSAQISTPSSVTPTNPVVVRAQYVSDTQVRLSVSNICDLPSTQTAVQSWAEYVGVWYQAGAFVATPDTGAAGFIRLGLAQLKQKAGCPGSNTVDTVVTVPALSGANPVYYVTASVRWHNPETFPAIQTANGDTVRMVDLTPPTNPCAVTGTYAGGTSDSATIAITGVLSIVSAKVASVVVLCALDSAQSTPFVQDTIPLDTVLARANGGTFSKVVRSTLFAGSRDTIFVRVVLVSKAGVASTAAGSSFEVGHDLPANPLTVTASATSSYEVRLNWNAGTSADSIRVWVRAEPIPADVQVLDTLGLGYRLFTIRANVTTYTVTNLNAQTLYYFALQAKVTPDWTKTSLQASAIATTLPIDTSLNVGNLVDVDTAYFDTAGNRLVAVWRYLTALPNGDEQYGYRFGTDSFLVCSPDSVPDAARIADAVRTVDTVFIALGENVLFNTDYYVAFRLRRPGGAWSDNSDSATVRIRTLDFWKEPIRYFKTVTGDTVEAFNGHVAIWYEGQWAYVAQPNYDTVQAWVPSPVPAGFIPVSVGFYATTNLEWQPFNMGLVWDSIPAGFSDSDVRMYRVTSSGWKVLHDSRIVSHRNMVTARSKFTGGDPLILAIDTIAPSYSVLTSTSAPVPPLRGVRDTISVSDNCVGVIAILRRSRGANNPVYVRTDTLTATTGTIRTILDSLYVTADNGVRAYLIVTDGRHVDTVNLSRQVIKANAGDISSLGQAWVPLRTVSVLDNTSMRRVLDSLVGPGVYDVKQCRIFRWFDPNATTENPTGPNAWIEYSDDKQALFSLTPGKLMWMKTKSSVQPNFGGGVTVSLRDTVTITLSPNSWTDVSVPHNYSVYLGDIIDATGRSVADSLEYYTWVSVAGRYHATPTYNRSLPDTSLHNRQVLLRPNSSTGYSINNTRSTSVSLRIPPTCAEMSQVPTLGRSVAKAALGRQWAIRVVASLDDGALVSPVILGYSAGAGGVRWFAMPPSFATAGVAAYDRARARRYGHTVSYARTTEGLRYDVAFFNDGDEAQRITWRLEGLESLGDSMRAMVVDPVNGNVVPAGGEFIVEVPAKTTVTRAVVLGGGSAVAGVLATVEPLAQFAAFPNPFRTGVTVQFMLPADVGRVEYRLIDAQGRLVFQQNQRRELKVGLNRFQWNGQLAQAGKATGGMYLLEVRVYDANGSRMARRLQRMMYLP